MTLKYNVIGLQNCMKKIQIVPEIQYGGHKHEIVVNLETVVYHFTIEDRVVING